MKIFFLVSFQILNALFFGVLKGREEDSLPN